MHNGPSKQDVLIHLREHYGLPFAEVARIMNTPVHPKELRDEFAGQAMQALIARSNPEKQTSLQDIVVSAYGFADAMLKERLKER